MKNSSSFWLFLVGLGSYTQFHFVGSLGISELPIFLLAPVIFIRDYNVLRKDGFLIFIHLTILACIGCAISSFVNNTPMMFFIKGIAHPYSLFAITVVLHRLLRNNLNGIKYILVGCFLSGIIGMFIFQPEVITATGGVNVVGAEAIEASLNDVLMIGNKMKSLLCLPVSINYLGMPTYLSVIAVAVSGFVYVFFSQSSGRSAAAATFLSVILIIAGRKKRVSIAALGRHIVLLVICLLVVVLLLKTAYSKAASSGVLGEGAYAKYVDQSRAGDSFLKILMMGRMELFCGVGACLDRPILGFGPKGEDTKGYVEEYLRKYGGPEDYIQYVQSLHNRLKMYGYVYKTIPTHSHIAMFWVYYGIAGLLIWIYVLWLIYVYFRRCASSIPQWYGYMVVTIPSAVWAILFSPYSGRVSVSLYITCLLIAKAVNEKKMMLPIEMEMEVLRHE